MNRRENSIELTYFNELFTEFHQRFVRFAYTYVDNYMEAEDIVMEAMTYYWENRTRLLETNPSAYIFATIKNKCLNYLRDQQYFQAASEQIIVLPNIRQVVEHWLLRHPEHADNPERSLVLAKSDGARCPFGFLDQRAA